MQDSATRTTAEAPLRSQFMVNVQQQLKKLGI
jgi:hypothetical protein